MIAMPRKLLFRASSAVGLPVFEESGFIKHGHAAA
jgi:hypothetical protein